MQPTPDTTPAAMPANTVVGYWLRGIRTNMTGITRMERVEAMGLLDDLKSAPVPDSGTEPGENKYAPAWRWENAGDGVEGVIVGMDSRVNDNHPNGYPIITLRQSDGTDIAVHALVTVLMNEVKERQLRVGDTFAAIYDGRQTSSSGRSFHKFRVAHQQGTGAPLPPPAAAPQQTAPDPWTQPAKQEIPPF